MNSQNTPCDQLDNLNLGLDEHAPLTQTSNTTVTQQIDTIERVPAQPPVPPEQITGQMLDDTFLRTSSSQDQLTADQEFARQLQEQENQRQRQAGARLTGNQRAPGPDDTQGFRIIHRLNVTICEAKLNKSYTLIPGVQRMDPYARCRVGHSMYSTQTHVNGDRNPIWDKQILATLPVGVNEIFIEVFDEHSFTEDKRCAWAVIEITEAVSKRKETVTKWYPLSGDLGENLEGQIKLVLSLQQYRENVIVRGGALDPNDMSPAMANIPPPVDISRNDVNQIVDMFPNLDDETIRSVLVSQGGNKERTITVLLQMQ